MIYAIYGVIAVALATAFYKYYYHPHDPEMPSLDHQPVIAEVVPPVAPKQPLPAPIDPQVRISAFCDALARFEGANPANNNPGNCRCSQGGYLPKYGKVLCNPHGFAVFPTLALGYEYLQNLVLNRVFVHPTWTFYDFFSNYAPSADHNDPKHYAEVIAMECGVIPTTILSHWLGGVA